MRSALDAFHDEFGKWVRAHDSPSNADALLDLLRSRIPSNTLTQIGAGLLNGWLRTNRTPGKGYYVRELGRPESSAGMTMLSRVGGGKVAPCWEYYLQLSDYCQLMPVSIARNLTVRLEDQLMDIAVWRDQHFLLLYIENKLSAATAANLLKKLITIGQSGFNLDDPDIGNDPLRKAKYIMRARPENFALRAIDYEKLFSVEFDGPLNQFELHEIADHFTFPMHTATGDGSQPPHRAADTLALALAQELGDRVWVSTGSRQTVLNVYLPDEAADSIVLGLYDNGQVWTDFLNIDNRLALHLVDQLAALDIQVDSTKQWSFWSRDGTHFLLTESEATAVASAFAAALGKRHTGP
jgi:hypothetical protein